MTFEPTVGLAHPSWTPISSCSAKPSTKVGNGDHDEREHEDRAVEEAALAQTGDEAEGDAEDALDDEGLDGEHGRDGEDTGQGVGNRLAGEVDAEVEGEEVLEEQPVLDPERFVQVVLLAQLRDDGLARRAVAEECTDGVARKGKDHEVDEQGGSEEDRNDLQQAPEDELDHSSASGELVERRGIMGDSFLPVSSIWGSGKAGPPSFSDVENEFQELRNYLAVMAQYCRTPFQPESTLLTFWLQTAWRAEYHSGRLGRSLNRISCAWVNFLLASSVDLAPRPSLRSLSNSGFE